MIAVLISLYNKFLLARQAQADRLVESYKNKYTV